VTFFHIPEPPYTIEGVMEDLHRQFAGSSVPDPAALGSQSPVADEAASLLAKAERARRVEPDYRIRSHRPLLRYLIDPVKRLIHWGARPYLRLLVEKQERFNTDVLELLRVQLERQRDTDELLGEVDRSLDDIKRQIEGEHSFLRAGLLGLEQETQRLREDLRMELRRFDEMGARQAEFNQYSNRVSSA